MSEDKIPLDYSLPRTILHCTTQHCTALHYTQKHRAALHYTVLYFHTLLYHRTDSLCYITAIYRLIHKNNNCFVSRK